MPFLPSPRTLRRVVNNVAPYLGAAAFTERVAQLAGVHDWIVPPSSQSTVNCTAEFIQDTVAWIIPAANVSAANCSTEYIQETAATFLADPAFYSQNVTSAIQGALSPASPASLPVLGLAFWIFLLLDLARWGFAYYWPLPPHLEKLFLFAGTAQNVVQSVCYGPYGDKRADLLGYLALCLICAPFAHYPDEDEDDHSWRGMLLVRLGSAILHVHWLPQFAWTCYAFLAQHLNARLTVTDVEVAPWLLEHPLALAVTISFVAGVVFALVAVHSTIKKTQKTLSALGDFLIKIKPPGFDEEEANKILDLLTRVSERLAALEAEPPSPVKDEKLVPQ